jgi:hypothetical protein
VHRSTLGTLVKLPVPVPAKGTKGARHCSSPVYAHLEGKNRRGTCIVKVSVIYQLDLVTWCSKDKFVVKEGIRNGNIIKGGNMLSGIYGTRVLIMGKYYSLETHQAVQRPSMRLLRYRTILDANNNSAEESQ